MWLGKMTSHDFEPNRPPVIVGPQASHHLVDVHGEGAAVRHSPFGRHIKCRQHQLVARLAIAQITAPNQTRRCLSRIALGRPGPEPVGQQLNFIRRQAAGIFKMTNLLNLDINFLN